MQIEKFDLQVHCKAHTIHAQMGHDNTDKDFPTGPWPSRRNKPAVGVTPCRFCRLDISHCYIGEAKQSRRDSILRHRRVSARS